MTTYAPEHVTAWERELDRLEQDLAASRSALAGDAVPQPSDWAAPDLGPLPASLLPRALDLLHRQHRLRDELAAAMGANTRQREFASKVTGATVAPSGPAYLDVSA